MITLAFLMSYYLTLQRLGRSNGLPAPLLVYLSSHENHFYTSPDAPGLLIKFMWAHIIHAAKTF